jgi:hypothetical protein
MDASGLLTFFKSKFSKPKPMVVVPKGPNLILAPHGFSQGLKSGIKELWCAGLKPSEIAQAYGMSEIVVRKILKRVMPRYGRLK